MWNRYQRRSVSPYALRSPGSYQQSRSCAMETSKASQDNADYFIIRGSAKRYERMMKAHGIHQPATSVRDTPIPSIRREPKASPSSSKKRKLDQFADAMSGTADDDEGLGKIKEEATRTIIKNEHVAIEENPAPVSDYQYSSGLSSQGLDLDDSSIFSDFLQSGAYEPSTFQAQGSYTGPIDQSVYDNFGNNAPSESGQGLHESIVITD